MQPDPQPLNRIVEAARESATTSLDVMAGPIPLALRGGDLRLLQQLADGLVGSEGQPWPPLDLMVVSAADVGEDLIPEVLVPHSDDTVIVHEGTHTAVSKGPGGPLWILDAATSCAVMWVAAVDDLPPWELVSPMRTPVQWWAALHGAALVHTGAVAGPLGAALLVGAGGAGKSTATMACWGQGLDVLGDDFCLVESPSTGDQAVRVHALHRRAKLSPDSLLLLNHLDVSVQGEGPRGKHLVDLGALSKPSQPVRVVCQVVQQAEVTTHLVPLSKVQALRAVAPSTMFHQHRWQPQTWQVLSDTVRSVPCYRLVVGSPLEVPDALGGLLNHQQG